jgi:hypothetical protein
MFVRNQINIINNPTQTVYKKDSARYKNTYENLAEDAMLTDTRSKTNNMRGQRLSHG